jgi:hypothetical protein
VTTLLYRGQPISGRDYSSRYADFIHSPLPLFNVREVQTTSNGQELDRDTTLNEITITGACTLKGWSHLNTKITKTLLNVPGYGEGRIGSDCQRSYFGSAGVFREEVAVDMWMTSVGRVEVLHLELLGMGAF